MRRACSSACAAWLLVLGLAVGAAPAAAEETDSACTKDVERLCPGIERGPKLRRCIQEKQPEFSPECKAHIEEREQRRRMFVESCSDDIRTYCPHTERGRGRIRRCLQAQLTHLAPECRSAMEQIPDAAEAP